MSCVIPSGVSSGFLGTHMANLKDTVLTLKMRFIFQKKGPGSNAMFWGVSLAWVQSTIGTCSSWARKPWGQPQDKSQLEWSVSSQKSKCKMIMEGKGKTKVVGSLFKLSQIVVFPTRVSQIIPYKTFVLKEMLPSSRKYETLMSSAWTTSWGFQVHFPSQFWGLKITYLLKLQK